MSLSPVQKFAALAVSTGDIECAFHASRLRETLEEPFKFGHIQTYYDGRYIVERFSSSRRPPLAAKWRHTIDTVTYKNPLGNDPKAVFSFHRDGQQPGDDIWRYWLACERSDRSNPRTIGVGTLLEFAEFRREKGNSFSLKTGIHGGTDANVLFNALTVLDKVLRAKALPPREAQQFRKTL